jgi:hypothetical protein
MNYKRTIEILQTAAKQADNNLRTEIESAITLIKSHSDNAKPKTDPNCKYNSNGLCLGQKCMPECTAGCGYCPVMQRKKVGV